jgi:probable F420-dependent oxidoreductase
MNTHTGKPFRIGAAFPQTEIEPDPVAIRDFAQAVEAMGYSHLVAYDHVIGADPANRPDWKYPKLFEDRFHEPLVLFAFLAGVTSRIEFSTSVIILPQRQTVLFGKQAANVDIFSGGRLTLGVGIGWNQVEYEALGMPFTQRGAMLDDQIRVLRRLWIEPSFSEHSARHDISEAGIRPLPIQRPIPIWLGGNSTLAMNRAARKGDGWMPILAASDAQSKVAEFHSAVRAAGRDPNRVGMENLITIGTMAGGTMRTAEDAVADVEAWCTAGATGVTVDITGMGLTSSDQHVAMLRRIKDMLKS